MSSLTVTFTGTSSVLRADFFPEITLDPNSNYCCALLDFTTYNSIPNISNVQNQNNDFTFKYVTKEKDGVKKDAKGKPIIKEVTKLKTISLPTGAYKVEDILNYLKQQFAVEKINFTYETSVITSKVKISFDIDIEWTDGTVLSVIGFKKENRSRIFKSKSSYWSDTIVKITNIDVIRVECDIISSSYINGKHCHTIHQFCPNKVQTGYKFIEVPKHIIYLPIKEKHLRSIQISIIDQNGKLIDFQGEQISCRIHIKKDSSFIG